MVRWQPVSPTLINHLHQHTEHRHAPRNGQLLRYTYGEPITTRRYVEADRFRGHMNYAAWNDTSSNS